MMKLDFQTLRFLLEIHLVFQTEIKIGAQAKEVVLRRIVE